LRKDVPPVNANSTLSEALGKMAKAKEHCLPVLDGSGHIRIFSYRELLKRRIINSFTKLKAFLDEFVPNISADDDLLKIASLMYHSNLRILPVFQNGRHLGFVHINDVLRNAFDELAIAEIKLADIASKPITLKADDTLAKLLALMRENDIKQVPVVDSNNALVGIVTLETLIDKYFVHATPKRELFSLKGHEPEAKNLFNMPLKGLVETPLTAQPNQTLGSVKAQLCDSKTVILIEKRKVCGIVTTRNVLGAILYAAHTKRNIQLANIPEFSEPDRKRVMRTINSFYDKVSRIFPDEVFLSVHFKRYGAQGMRRRHAVHAKISAAGFSANSNAESWNALSALQDALKSLSNEITKYRDKNRP